MARPTGVGAGKLGTLNTRPAKPEAQVVEDRKLVAREFFDGDGRELRREIFCRIVEVAQRDGARTVLGAEFEVEPAIGAG